MINIEKLSLPVCALGAGTVHVVVLALVLPMSIALPGPSESMAPKQIAIQVKILEETPVAGPEAQPEVAKPEVSSIQPQVSSIQPEVSSIQSEVSSVQPLVAQPLEARPDTIDGLLQNVSVASAPAIVTASPPVTVTTSAPEPANLPDASDDITGSLSDPASVMDEATPSEVVPDEIAEEDAELPPLPTRVRRDANGTAIVTVRRAAPKPVRRAARANPPRPVTVKRATGPFQGALGSLFGRPTNNRSR